MSEYSTGEVAKLCGVSVRTVQFYDAKGLVKPALLSEGGRRVYTDADVERMRLVLFLKNMGLNLNSIQEILTSEHPEKVLLLLLEQREEEIAASQRELEAQKRQIAQVREIIGAQKGKDAGLTDIEHQMKEQKQRRALRRRHMLWIAVGSLCSATEVATVLLWIFSGRWLPFALSMAVIVVVCSLLTWDIYRICAYLCPECGRVFRPTFRQFFFAAHTPKTRKLTCIHCGHRGYCVETYPTLEVD